MNDVEDERLWAAVGEPSRRRLVDLLVTRGEATPTALAEELPFTRQAVSKHLAVLLDAGLVTQRRDGREVRYAIEPEQLTAASRAMAAAAARWEARLKAIKQIAEATHREGSPPQSRRAGRPAVEPQRPDRRPPALSRTSR